MIHQCIKGSKMFLKKLEKRKTIRVWRVFQRNKFIVNRYYDNSNSKDTEARDGFACKLFLLHCAKINQG